ncbi:restriction endonuclease subunit S [Paenibacillus fonticola]|uniref:restriction endonuclease subunit S n=1 Tax=Paenibacillus fonticola TaxID=379896 RepID=UPI000366F615|nr:restriction endonuclease subunit S [Paenibacillus fonticola]
MSFEVTEEVTIGELLKQNKLDIQTGPFGTMLQASSYVDRGVPVIAVKDIGVNKVIHGQSPCINETDANRLSKYKLKSGDIIFGRKGAVERRALITANEEGWIQGSDCMRIRFKSNDINPTYISYFFGSEYYKSWILQNAQGTTMLSLNQEILKRVPLPIKPLEIQNRIATILKTLDDKIGLNNAINKNLEEMAQALFKRWFIDFEFPNENGEPYKSSGGEFEESELGLIPKGWRVSVLSDVADILMGQSPKSEFYNEKGEGLPFHQGVTNYGFRYPSLHLYSSQLLRVASQGSILLSVRAPVGRINIANTDIVIGRGLGALNSKLDCNSYLFYLLKNLFMKEDQYGSGTIFNSITKKELENIKLIRPSDSIVQEYEKICSKIDEKVLSLSKETDALIQTRDTLLPKLMSGEIRVPLDEEELVNSNK